MYAELGSTTTSQSSQLQQLGPTPQSQQLGSTPQTQQLNTTAQSTQQQQQLASTAQPQDSPLHQDTSRNVHIIVLLTSIKKKNIIRMLRSLGRKVPNHIGGAGAVYIEMQLQFYIGSKLF
jgi:DNA-binding IclR family transcriptional regulator